MTVPDRFGTWLIIAGITFVIVGVIANFGLLSWFGRLPGDLRLRVGGTQVFLPLTSMIIVSLLLSGVLSLFRR
ncbi:MAG: DUF2905 domain-containing protein [Pseudomonadales bacterium]|nr:DUF2905 domain-containing protein [Pseudomonadales bacterium]